MNDRQPEVFLLRVWAEPRTIVGQLTAYRARVEHVGHDRVRFFSTLNDLPGFIQACLDDGDLPPGHFRPPTDGSDLA